jgi:hypothetical protein
MKQIFSLFMFGIGALLFLAFFATLKPTDVTAASGPGEPGQCSTKAPPTLACRLLQRCGLRSCSRSDQRGPRIVRQIPLRMQSAVRRSYFPTVHYSNPTLIS